MAVQPAHAQVPQTSITPLAPDYVDRREDRMIIYSSVPRDIREYVYKARAVAEGNFVIPLAFAEARCDRSIQYRGGQSGPFKVDARVGSRQIVDRSGQLLRLTLSGDERYRLFTPLEEMPKGAVEAVLLHEDHFFRYHLGVNPWSLGKAFVPTYLHGSRRRGGSTITMQLARLTSTHGSKTLTGKLYQIARAIYIESLYSKDEILEACGGEDTCYIPPGYCQVR